jgi:ESF2/ABP1 family protein
MPPEDPHESVEEASKSTTPGVLYLPRVPPYMHAHKLRHLLAKFGEIGRIYLTPEDETTREKRVKRGGQKKTMYLDGWVEFESKAEAKAVTLQLNGQLIGGKKQHNFYRDDIWTMRYLPKFVWQDLHEHLVAKKMSRQKRLDQRLERANKEDEFFLKNVMKNKKKKSTDDKEWVFRQKPAYEDQKISNSLLSTLAL